MASPNRSQSLTGALFLCATPIGNLQDISFRAIDALKSVDLIAAESAEETKKLLRHYQIQKPLISYYDKGDSSSKENQLIEILKEGKSIALVSSAGTPLMSDPGYRLVKRCIEDGISVTPIPGPTACIAALTVSGLPPHPFYFAGFLPAKKNERKKILTEIGALPCSLVFYESPHRIHESLDDCIEILGNRPAALSRELTKIHEETIRGKLRDIAGKIKDKPVKGELTLVIGGNETHPEISEAEIVEEIDRLLQKGLPVSQASRETAKKYGLSKNKIYALAHRPAH